MYQTWCKAHYFRPIWVKFGCGFFQCFFKAFFPSLIISLNYSYNVTVIFLLTEIDQVTYSACETHFYVDLTTHSIRHAPQPDLWFLAIPPLSRPSTIRRLQNLHHLHSKSTKTPECSPSLPLNLLSRPLKPLRRGSSSCANLVCPSALCAPLPSLCSLVAPSHVSSASTLFPKEAKVTSSPSASYLVSSYCVWAFHAFGFRSGNGCLTATTSPATLYSACSAFCSQQRCGC